MYQIGQYRYEGAQYTVGDLTGDFDLVYRKTDTDGGAFKDVAIRCSELSTDKDYYFKVKVPQDKNYDLSFNLQLMKSGGSSDEYQWLSSVTVPRGGSGGNAYLVALYKYGDEVKAMRPKVYGVDDGAPGDLFYEDSTGNYYTYDGSSYTVTYDYNDLYVNADWDQEYSADDSTMTSFEIVFRPIEDGFTDIVLSMVRSGVDWNIQTADDDGNVTYGRVIPISGSGAVSFEVLEVKSLMSRIKRNKLTKIGVNGHPGMFMAINGEQVRVGPSGVYEFDALPVESLGVVARDYGSNFTIDYIYED
jgi:hypothetical protein